METSADASRQYEAMTAGAGLVDRSAKGKLALSGEDRNAFLNGQVTNEIVALNPGHGCYAALLTHKGKMRSDLRILATDDELLLDCERAGLQALFDTIRTFKLGYDVELHKRTLERCLFSVIGPDARAVTGAVQAGLGDDEHDHVESELDGLSVRLITTDLGVDVLADANDHDALEAALTIAGATGVSEPVAEILRIESGRPRFGTDLDEHVIPQEAGLNERAVSFTKGCYVGQETVARLFYKGKPNRHLRGLRSDTAIAPTATLHAGEKTVGTVTSAACSPTLGPIALAFIRREVELGTTVVTGEGQRATVCELPFSDVVTN